MSEPEDHRREPENQRRKPTNEEFVEAHRRMIPHTTKLLPPVRCHGHRVREMKRKLLAASRDLGPS